MGATPGMSGGQMGLSLLKSGLGGLSQGLNNYSGQRQGFDFSKLQQGLQPRRPALGQGMTPNSGNQFSQSNYWGGDPNINGGFYT